MIHAHAIAPIRLCLRLAAAALLGGCIFQTDNRVAGGAEDFPNKMEPVGAAMSDDIGSHSEWDQFSDIPAALPSFEGNDSLILLSGAIQAKGGAVSLGLGKGLAGETGEDATRAAADTVSWDLRDTAKGIARRIIHQSFLTKVRRDTTEFLYDGRPLDSLAKNGIALAARGLDSTRTGIRVQRYRYENTDSAGGFDKGAFFLRLRGLGGIYRNQWLLAQAATGKDLSDKDAAVPLYFAFAKTREGEGRIDTLDAYAVTDADAEAGLWGPGDSGLVDIRMKATEPPGRPAVMSVSVSLRARLFKQDQKTYPLSYSESRIDRDGKRVVFSIRGTKTDSTFAPGDEVFISVRTVPPEGHRVAERTAVFRVLLSETPKRFEENGLIDFTLETRWRPETWKKGGLTRTRLKFTPDAPLLSRNLDLSGEVEVEIDFADGSTGTVTGIFRDKRIEATFIEKLTGGQKRRFRVHYDSRGLILLREMLP